MTHSSPTTVTPTHSTLCGDLHHFDKPALFEFPYLCMPLVWGVDAAVGVLAADACDEVSVVVVVVMVVCCGVV